MTPLAMMIAKQRAMPKVERWMLDRGDLQKRITGAQCFECSEIIGAATDFAMAMMDEKAPIPTTYFLPAPLTWIEYRSDEHKGERIGYLLRMTPDGRVEFTAAKAFENGRIASHETYVLPVSCGNPWFVWIGLPVDLIRLIALLAMINTPRVFGRRQHMPHAGLQRKLSAAQGMTGKFPLRAWTEIKLEVRLPRDESESGEHVAVLTGRKCLHFCRAHLRVQNGQIVFVSSCWRGDPSLGIKRSRYSLIPPRDGSPPKVFIP